MQQKRSRDSAGQAAIDRLVLVIKRINHHHLRGDRAGGLVHIVVESDVRVRIDDAGREVFAAGIDHGGGRGRVYILPNRRNLAILDVDAAVLHIAVGDGHDHGVLDQNFIMRRLCGRLLRRTQLGQQSQNYK